MRFGSFMGRALLRAVLGTSALGAAGLHTPVVFAQSAADKATARQLATDGIELFKAGKIADALDKLQRAQALYDAPVHLIYIARCHSQLGQFVEAAEAYRKLVRTQLPDNAPAVFKDAVADAKKELPDVEPKIASLRIDVEPKNIQALEVKIDDSPVSTAALGVDRPVNPGSRKVVASAPGYKTVERSLELKPGEKKKLVLTLEADGSAVGGTGGTGGAGGEGGTSGKAGEGGEGGKGGEPVDEAKGNLGFLVGLRVGAAIPAGQIANDFQMKDYFGPGGGAELRGGVRVFKQYSALLVLGGESYQPGKSLETGPPGTVIKVTPNGTNAGVGLMYSVPPGKLGLFAELDFLFVHNFEAKRDVKLTTAGGGSCEQTLKAHGTAFRLTGGLQVPLVSWLQLSPYAGLGFGSINDFSADDTCGGASLPANLSGDLLKSTPWAGGGAKAEDKPSTHFVVTLGVGGDLIFGSDKPAK